MLSSSLLIKIVHFLLTFQILSMIDAFFRKMSMGYITEIRYASNKHNHKKIVEMRSECTQRKRCIANTYHQHRALASQTKSLIKNEMKDVWAVKTKSVDEK